MPTTNGENELPIRWDLTGEDAIVQGATWERYSALTYLDPVTSTEIVWDTTGYTARMTIRPSVGAAAVLELTTENGRLAVGDPDWTVKMSLTPAATAGLADWGLGYYSLEIIDAFGHEYRIHDGRCALRRGDA